MIGRIALRDRAAFDRLYDATSAKLHAVCLSVLKDRPEAEETLQEVYIRIWNSAGSYASNGYSPMTWLITIARNRSIDRLRKRQNRPQAAPVDAAETIPSQAPGPEALALRAQQRALLADCLAQLEDRQADAVRAVYLEGAAYAEIAEREGAPLNTVRSWLRRSLLKLKECVSR
ncbi:sigma-70 family RNA polymerase sigma factor [Paracoccus sp. TK19116]|uniref:Sigma-70 family RNA polymerase sigma factor n=2 Tax=Paracoccus albicereus TaxID=2922394 RepID=A0ABT1MV79_9RHOB|nr:sigma-70 family RNA polymerase sigma factor [Paracoccus albicereus]MCQ0971193.1 sigma-70 family RNA polymerase sigma factor [Paracoccus albicereus]